MNIVNRMKLKNFSRLRIHFFLFGLFCGFFFDLIFYKNQNEEYRPEKTKLCFIILSKYENLTIPLISNLKSKTFQNIQILYEKNLNSLNFNNLYGSEWYFFTTDQIYLNQKEVKNFIKYLSEYQNDTFVCGHDSGFLISRINFLKSVKNNKKCFKNQPDDSKKLIDHFKQCLQNHPCPTKIQKFFINAEALNHSESDINSNILSVGNIQSYNLLKKIENYFEISEIRAEIKKYEAVINESPQDSEHWPLGLNQPLKSPNPQSYYRWKYFDENFLYDYLYTNQTLDENFRENIKKIKQHIIDAINNKESDKFNLKRMINGYILNDPWFGTYYVIDAAIENVKTKKNSIKRFHLMLPLTEMSVELFEKSASKKINVLVPFGKFGTEMKQFLENLENNILKKNLSSSIESFWMVYITDSDQNTFPLSKIIQGLNNIYHLNIQIKKVIIRSPFIESVYFQQLVALENLLSSYAESSLVLIVPLNAVLQENFFTKAFENTLLNSRVFFPISFDLFNSVIRSKIKNKQLGANGYFNQYSYEIASFFVSDYLDVRNVSDVVNERKMLFELFNSYSNLFVFRSIEKKIVKQSPEFYNCDQGNFAKNEQENCLWQKSLSYGEKKELWNFLIENNNKLNVL